MVVYVEEEEVWKCSKHPSKKRKSGVCPLCLKDRLVILCPDCANVRPCACCAPAGTASSSSSSSSSLSGGASVGRVSNLIDGEPSFRRSRSVAIPFLRSLGVSGYHRNLDMSEKTKTPSFWSVFKSNKSKRREELKEQEVEEPKVSTSNVETASEINETDNRIEDFARMMMRSRSVGVGKPSGIAAFGGRGEGRAAGKGKGWHFPSPIKAFRQSKTSKVVQERSPLYRG